MMKSRRGVSLAILLFSLAILLGQSAVLAAEIPAAKYRSNGEPVTPQADGSIICEAEEFKVETPGWEAKPWGTNYYAATFANCFLSRKSYLGAPEQADGSTASVQV